MKDINKIKLKELNNIDVTGDVARVLNSNEFSAFIDEQISPDMLEAIDEENRSLINETNERIGFCSTRNYIRALGPIIRGLLDRKEYVKASTLIDYCLITKLKSLPFKEANAIYIEKAKDLITDVNATYAKEGIIIRDMHIREGAAKHLMTWLDEIEVAAESKDYKKLASMKECLTQMSILLLI